jgi:WD40-like Beta Propeller Repeat
MPEISSPDCLEIWPAWSPDCKVLYFCSAPKKENFEDTSVAGLEYDKIKYDLIRIASYPVSRVWGKLETIISSSEIGLNITEPRVSPVGRFVLFTIGSIQSIPDLSS